MNPRHRSHLSNHRSEASPLEKSMKPFGRRLLATAAVTLAVRLLGCRANKGDCKTFHPTAADSRQPLGCFVRMYAISESDLHRALKDTRLVGGGYDLAEGIGGKVGVLSGCSTGGSSGIPGGDVEVGMVQDVKGFQT